MSVHRCNTCRTRETLQIERLQQGRYAATPAEIHPWLAGPARPYGELNYAKWIYA